MSSEADAIAAVDHPATASSLAGDLQALGLGPGHVVIVHSSLSGLGWVAGGAQAVVEALLATVGTTGTIVMATQSGQLGDPVTWSDPPVPDDWINVIRTETPAYDPDLTPTRSMGAVVECFRQHRSTVRSAHPLHSFAANGPHGHQIVGGHRFDDGFGESSPLRALHDLDALILLLQVGHGKNTSLHLAEHRANYSPKQRTSVGAPMRIDGERQWVTAEVLEPIEDDFGQIGDALAATDLEVTGAVAGGSARLMSMRPVVAFAADWMTEHRPASLAGS